MTGVRAALAEADQAARLSVEDFQSREILLLQDGRYNEWLEMLTEDIRYWMPNVRVRERREEMVGGDRDISWFDDSIATLRLRVERFKTGLAVEESIPSRLRYFVQNLRITPGEAGAEIEIVSNVMVYKTRREDQEAFYVGGREDTLRLVDGQWKLAYRKIVLDRAVRGGLTHLGVFF